MSKLYDFLYADTGVVKNKENCHDARKLERYSETALMTSLPLLNSLKFNLKNMKALNKHLFGDLIYNAGETKVELGIENENLADFNSAKEMFDKEWLKERVKDEEVDARKFAEKMAFFLVTVEATNPFLYGSLDTYCTYANYIAKVNGIDMDFNRKTIAHHEDIYVDYDLKKYKEAIRTRWDPYKNEPMQQASSLCYVLRRIVNEPSPVEDTYDNPPQLKRRLK